MPTTERDSFTLSRDQVALSLLVGLALIVVAVLGWHFWPVPQLGADEEVFKTVDALFTAVTARNEKLLGECEQRLHRDRNAGKLPKAAGQQLDGVIAKARAGAWQSAAERLYDFMKKQRRVG